MSGNVRTLIYKINKSCDDLEFVDARRLIQFNLTALSGPSHYRQLNENAKVLIKHIVNEENNKGCKPLNRLELLKINNINQYCSEFDISMLKRALRDSISMDLIQRPDVRNLLNKDAQIVLSTMGALLKA